MRRWTASGRCPGPSHADSGPPHDGPPTPAWNGGSLQRHPVHARHGPALEAAPAARRPGERCGLRVGAHLRRPHRDMQQTVSGPENAYKQGRMAEEVGFEPTVRFHARRFSRPVHSTTLPLLRSGLGIGRRAILKAPGAILPEPPESPFLARAQELSISANAGKSQPWRVRAE